MEGDRISRSTHGVAGGPDGSGGGVERGLAHAGAVVAVTGEGTQLVERWRERPFWASAVVVILVLCAGCAPFSTAETRTETRSVGLGGARSVEAEVQLGSGDLELSGGADGAMSGSFSYGAPEGRPEVDYAVGEGRGRLTVRRPESVGGLWGRGAREEWDLALNDAVPLALRVENGSGDSRIDSNMLDLTALDLASGSGNVTADLSADHRDLESISAEAGSGNLALELSGDYPSLAELGAKTGSGDLAVDLTGGWRGELAARIGAGSGDVTVRLPEGAGVRAVVESGSGGVDAGGLQRDGDAYVNEAYGRSDATLRLDVSTGSGDVTLELAR